MEGRHVGVWGKHVGVWGRHVGVWGKHVGVWGKSMLVCGGGMLVCGGSILVCGGGMLACDCDGHHLLQGICSDKFYTNLMVAFSKQNMVKEQAAVRVYPWGAPCQSCVYPGGAPLVRHVRSSS